MASTLADEVTGADLGDKRLNKRLIRVTEELGASPNLSIPAATDGRAEMEAAYRFFDNDKVSPEKILDPHREATLERMRQSDLVVLAQDTTELDLTRPSQQVLGAGRMDSDSRQGAFHHPLMGFSADGIPLGTVWEKTWTREPIDTSLTKAEKQRQRAETPIEKKESFRWIEGIRAAREASYLCPDTTCVCVSDSESDVYEVFQEVMPSVVSAERVSPDTDGQTNNSPQSQHDNFHLLVRAGQDRSTDTGDWLNDARAVEELMRNSVKVSQRRAKIKTATSPRSKSREARTAEVSVRATRVTLKPPRRFDRKLPVLRVNLVLVEETDPPAGCDPIRWLLVTTLPIDTPEDVEHIVALYCLRWQIEVYFRTLKTGCRVERRQFETLKRIQNSLAVYSIIAWRVMYLCHLGRECPDLCCEVVFSRSEWQSIYAVANRGEVPDSPPRLNDVIRLVSSFGGYVVRPRTRPGPQTLWVGLQRLHCFSLAWDAFGPGPGS